MTRFTGLTRAIARSLTFAALLSSCAAVPRTDGTTATQPSSSSSPTPAASQASQAPPPGPKYGPEITLLRNSHEYLRENPAPDYWALSPYYIGTPGECACSTSLAMIVNAARIRMKLTADDKMAIPKEMVEKVKPPGLDWKKRIEDGHGINLDQIPIVLDAALRFYGVTKFHLEAVHTRDLSKATRAKLHKDLLENEKSDRNFIVLNFVQGVYTGDPGGTGHISPLGAYDAKRKRALVFDTDREWYEPYWVSEERLLKGMATTDKESDGLSRGYVVVKLEE